MTGEFEFGPRNRIVKNVKIEDEQCSECSSPIMESEVVSECLSPISPISPLESFFLDEDFPCNFSKPKKEIILPGKKIQGENNTETVKTVLSEADLMKKKLMGGENGAKKSQKDTLKDENEKLREQNEIYSQICKFILKEDFDSVYKKMSSKQEKK